MNFLSKQWLGIFLVTLVYLVQLSPQTSESKFDQLGIEQGLSQSTVNAIVQDTKGFMWFGTQDGLNRYNAYSMEVFKHNPADSNSISDNYIWSLMCDSKGDLWIGTARGILNRYVCSENKFYHYRYIENDSTHLSGLDITTIFEDSKGNIWIGTGNRGLKLFDKKKETFIQFHFADEYNELNSATVWKICEDNSGDLWAATQQGLFRIKPEELLLNPTRATCIKYNLSDVDNLDGSNIRCLYFDKNENLWIGTWGDGLCFLDQKENRFVWFKNNPKNIKSISGNYITSVFKDSNGLLWIGTYDGGLNLYNSNNNSFVKYIDDGIITIYEDNSGILWCGTYVNGVKLLDRRKNKFTHFYDDPEDQDDLNGNQVFAILMDRDEELWIGTWGNGINRLNRKTGTVTNYVYNSKDKFSLQSNQIYSLCESSDGSIWIGTLSGGLSRFDKDSNKFINYRHEPGNPNSILSDNVSSVFFDEETNILFIGYAGGGISLYEIQKNIFTHFVPDEKNPDAISGSDITVIYKGKKSGLWIGTSRAGLNRGLPESEKINLQVDSFKCFQSETDVSPGDNSPGRSINNNGIYTVYEDDDGIVWIGTDGGGLNRYDPVTDSFKYYTTYDGLPNDKVYGIEPGKNGNLWLSTNRGLSQFNPLTGEFRNFDANDGLQSNEFNWNAHFSSAEGELFFGGVNGFNSFFPDEIEENKFIPPVYLTGFKVLDKTLNLPNPVPLNSTIEFSYSQNFFSFEFTALNYTLPEKNKFSYKLEGFDNDWHIVPAAQRYASYTNLNPGKYILRVKGSNNDKVWNETGTSVTIIITPPFWMTWWFRTVVVVFILVIIALIIRHFLNKKIREKTRIIEQQTAVERERLRIARDMHDELGAKVTQISMLSEIAKQNFINDKPDSKTVEDHLNEISDVGHQVANTLDKIVWSVNPKNDTLESSIDYIIHHAEQFLSKLNIKYRLDIPPDIPSIPILFDIRHNLFMTIQEALNNIVKHSKATEVNIKIGILPSKLIISLRDNGKGFDLKSAHSSENNNNSFSNGLNNMKKRLEDIGGKFNMNSRLGEGTEITAELPINNK